MFRWLIEQILKQHCVLLYKIISAVFWWPEFAAVIFVWPTRIFYQCNEAQDLYAHVRWNHRLVLMFWLNATICVSWNYSNCSSSFALKSLNCLTQFRMNENEPIICHVYGNVYWNSWEIQSKLQTKLDFNQTFLRIYFIKCFNEINFQSKCSDQISHRWIRLNFSFIEQWWHCHECDFNCFACVKQIDQPKWPKR